MPSGTRLLAPALRRCATIFVSLYALFVLSDSPVLGQAEGDVPSIETLHAACAKQLGSVGTMFAEYTIDHSASAVPDLADPAPGGKKESLTPVPDLDPRRREWARDGSRFYHAEYFGDGTKTSTHFDGETYYSLAAGAVSDPQHIQVMDSLSHTFELNFSPDTLLGNDLVMTHRNLLDVLTDDGARVAGQVAVDGVDCWRIEVDSLPNHDQSAINKLNVYLDPEVDYLPRRILMTESDAPVDDGDLGGWYMDWHITEFAQVEDSGTGDVLWFPMAGVLHQNVENKVTLVVTKVELNKPLPDTLFHPAVNEGDAILDATSAGSGEMFLAGSDATLDKQMGLIVNHTQTEDQSAAERGNAGNGGFRLWMVVVNVVLAGAIVAFLLVRRRSAK